MVRLFTLANMGELMTDEQLAELREKLSGCTFEVDDDPDYEGFFSVFAYRDGSGVELAGKIGESSVAAAIASTLHQLCK